MRIFGSEVEERYIIAFAAGSIFGGGFFYVAYKLLKRGKGSGRRGGKRLNNNDVDCEADLMLPVNLEREYGNCRKVCLAGDESASAYLKQIPEHFFQFQEKFATLISNTLDSKKCTRALVIGSQTGALTFRLAKTFAQVKGVEKSFSQIATCFRFQNRDSISYHFPLEGSLKTAERTVSSPLAGLTKEASPSRKWSSKIRDHERIEFVNCDPSNLPDYIGEFELVIVNNCLNGIYEVETFLKHLSRVVESGGTLVISTDYNWDRNTNQATGFSGLPVSDSFELLQYILEPHFTLSSHQNLPEALCISNRSCKISNNHVTLWSRSAESKK